MGSVSLRQSIGNGLFALLVFLFVADPTNTIFGLKMAAFALVFVYNILFQKADWLKLRYFFLACLAVLLPWGFAMLRGEVIDNSECVAMLTVMAPLLLLPWVGRYDILALSVFPVILVVAVVLILYWLIFYIPRLEGVVYDYMCAHDHTLMLSRRAFLGYSMFFMYCKSTVAFLPVFSLVLYRVLSGEKRSWAMVVALLFFIHLFLISGTRSTIMLPLFLTLAVVFLFYRNKRYVNYFMYPSFVIVLFALSVVLILMLTEVTEHSNMVKYAHLDSYTELFCDNPLYLLTGQGPGTAFYTAGFHKMSLKTEWSYLELFRNFGIFALVIIYIFFKPLVKLCREACCSDEAIAVALSYVTYLVIAGTNPLLLSSTGMLVLLTMYSYLECRCVKNCYSNNRCDE